MNCKRVLDDLSEYLDGRLAPDAAGALRSHLASCAACREREAATIDVIEWGRRFPVFEAPAWLVSTILANTPRRVRETWLETLEIIGRWVLEPRTAMAVFTGTIVVGWMLNVAGISPSLEAVRSPAAVYYTAGDIVDDIYDEAVRFYYRAPVVTQIRSRIEQLRESS